MIKRIYEHCIEQGWLTEGSKIVDPFGGVGLGGYHALQNGMHWLGVELEPAFVRLGSGYDCPGFTQADWTIRQQMDEPDQKNFVTHLCPTCQKTIAGEKVMGLLLEQAPHRFEGNIDLWERRYGGHFRKWGTAGLVQGDSRKLGEVVRGAVDGICTSPPWQESLATNVHTIRDIPGIDKHSHRKEGQIFPSEVKQEYGQSPGQLAQMPPGDADAIITSSPYLGTVGSDDPDKRGGLYRDPKRRDDVNLTATYGESEGQLAGMDEGEIDMTLTSPPYADAVNAQGEGPGMAGNEKQRKRILAGDLSEQAAQSRGVGYGAQDGQLAAMPAGKADSIVSSPPFLEAQSGGGIADTGTPHMGKASGTGGYRADQQGDSEGQLSAMPAGEITLDGLAAFSPNAPEVTRVLEWKRRQAREQDTFWSAARIIISECFAILKPGGVAVFVVKSFVRKGKIVDFPGQWQRLCESVGFETIEFIRAWLIEERGQQYDLFGKLHIKTVERKSFFRRLAESKGSPRIDFEVVLVMQKPLETK